MRVEVLAAGNVGAGEAFRLYDLGSASALGGLSRIAQFKEHQIIVNDDGFEKTAAICPGLGEDEMTSLNLREVTGPRQDVAEYLGLQLPVAEVIPFPEQAIESAPEAA